MNDEEIRLFKPKLRFKIGDCVYLKADKKQNTLMTVTAYADAEDSSDYVLKWLNSQKTMECVWMPDSALVPEQSLKS